MNCKECDLALFECDVVNDNYFINEEFHKQYRCPRCFHIMED